MRNTDALYRSVLLSLSGLVLFTGAAHAQDILWKDPQPINGIKDISNRGTYADAIQTYATTTGVSASKISIGDTTFFPVTAGTDSYSDGKMISFAITSGQLFFASNYNANLGWNSFPSSSPSSSDYSAVVSNGVYINKGDPNGTVTFSQLQTGHTYEVQVWVFVQDGEHSLTTLSGKNPVTLDNLAGNVPPTGPLPPGSYGQYVIGTFTANGPTEKFDWSCAGGSYALISSIALRDISNASPNP
jgi:hypothetical protein